MAEGINGKDITQKLTEPGGAGGLEGIAQSNDLILENVSTNMITENPGPITLFAIDAIGGPISDIEFDLYIPASGLTFTPAVMVTIEEDTVTLSEVLYPVIDPIVAPGVSGHYHYRHGDLGEGQMLEFVLTATGVLAGINAVMTYKSGV